VFLAIAVVGLLALAPTAMASRTLETITVPAKRSGNETSATFKTRLKKDRLYAVRFSGSYRIDDTSWDPAYCFDGSGDCAEPSPSAVAVVQHFRRVKGAEPMYSHAFNFFHGAYPAFRGDHTYTLPFRALFHAQLRSAACPFAACDDVGSFRARLVQRPFPDGYLHLWGEDCRDGERHDTTITFSARQCERVHLSGESGPNPDGSLRLQRKARRWKDIGSATAGRGAFPIADLALRGGRGTDRFRAVLAEGGRILKKSNVVTINWIG
jgi:hypothetical protein